MFRNSVLYPIVAKLCWGETTTAVSPKGHVTVHFCEGPCQSWSYEAAGYQIWGWRLFQHREYVQASETLAKTLRENLELEAAGEVEELTRIFITAGDNE